VVVPEDVRKALHLTAGDLVYFTVQAIGAWARTPVAILVRATPPEVMERPTSR